MKGGRTNQLVPLFNESRLVRRFVSFVTMELDWIEVDLFLRRSDKVVMPDEIEAKSSNGCWL